METFGKKSKKELLEKNANIHIPPEVKQDNDVDEDYEYARKMYRSLLKTGTDSLENLADLANDSEHPRAFEVLSTSIKNLSDVADKLMNLQKSDKEVIREVNIDFSTLDDMQFEEMDLTIDPTTAGPNDEYDVNIEIR